MYAIFIGAIPQITEISETARLSCQSAENTARDYMMTSCSQEQSGMPVDISETGDQILDKPVAISGQNKSGMPVDIPDTGGQEETDTSPTEIQELNAEESTATCVAEIADTVSADPIAATLAARRYDAMHGIMRHSAESPWSPENATAGNHTYTYM